jgi:hypothetical protein
VLAMDGTVIPGIACWTVHVLLGGLCPILEGVVVDRQQGS